MQRLRVLILPAVLLALALPAAAQTKPAAKPAPADKPASTKMKVGELLSFDAALPQVLPEPGSVKVAERKGRPMAILFWGRNTPLSKEVLVDLDAYARKHELAKSMDIYAVGSFKEGRMKPEDLREAALIEGVTELPILADEGFALSRKIGAQQFPEIALFSNTGQLLIRGIRSVDHRRLGPKSQTAGQLMRDLAANGTFPVIKRAFPSYPGDKLIGRHYPDFELPRFHPEGWGKGLTERLSNLLSGERPAVVVFFSSTCKHCKVDVPQLVQFQKDHPGLFDIVGITRIKNENHRAYSERYFKEQGIQFPILEDVGAVSELYRVNSTPTSYYIAPNGRVTKTRYYQYQDLEKEYLKLHPLLMGAPAPAPARKDRGWHFPMTVTDPAGKSVDLASLQGKPTLLHFWATWCKPCREELPGLMRRLPELEQNANVLLVSVDEDPSKVGSYQEKAGLEFKSYHSPRGGLAEDIDFARSVPRTYLLDGNGRLTKILSGSYDWDDPHRYTGVLGRLKQ